jgi:hypothetical protein
MILQLVASTPVPAPSWLRSGISTACHWALSDADRLDQRERATPWLGGQSIHGTEKPRGLFSSSADQQEQPFVQLNANHSLWIK